MHDMKIRKYKSNFNSDRYIFFKDKNVEGTVWSDGSGHLLVKDERRGFDYCREDAKHKDRVADIKRLANFYTSAYKTLLKINKKLNQAK